MDTTPPSGDRTKPARFARAADTRRRLAREAEMIAEADADIAAGRVVEAAEVDAWIDSIGGDHERPVPYSGR
jgi:predicted transcriptional regulator